LSAPCRKVVRSRAAPYRCLGNNKPMITASNKPANANNTLRTRLEFCVRLASISIKVALEIGTNTNEAMPIHKTGRTNKPTASPTTPAIKPVL
jgi:hypothetical protein